VPGVSLPTIRFHQQLKRVNRAQNRYYEWICTAARLFMATTREVWEMYKWVFKDVYGDELGAAEEKSCSQSKPTVSIC